ncbi:F-box/RNI-like superfamily protein [Rhynchospora pubera]|uniref:F-box/RNI-like superfamily protein n=1 Tax=Rhynchospora pubera TaxID=906938 RepID=A0AAV8DWX3_9POAL|nr:F-box/RNI-like superfamily protein [Rhynchospora pubera]
MENNLSCTDMISDLPDALVTHILSFLSPKEAVKTCMLSRRWRSTWASMPVLKFDYEKFQLVPKNRTEENWVKFIKFVGHVLQNRERSLSLDTFEFKCSPSWYPTVPFPIQYILLALRFNPRVFSIYASRGDILDCAELLFQCASLQSISLNNTLYRYRTDKFFELKVVNLPYLKKLELSYLKVEDNLCRMLFQGCRVLEELKLLFCRLHVSLLSSEVLNSLVLTHCYFEKKLVISTRNLMHLDVFHTRCDGANFLLENMASLVDAHIRCFDVDMHDNLESSNCGLVFHNSYSKFSMTSDHTLESAQATAMGQEASNCSDFKVVKSLHLGCSDLRNLFSSIAFFLQKSPNLKKLSVELFPKPYMCKKSSNQEWRNARSSYEEFTDALLQREYLEVVLIIENLSTKDGRVTKLVQELYSLSMSTRKIVVIVQTKDGYHYLC